MRIEKKESVALSSWLETWAFFKSLHYMIGFAVIIFIIVGVALYACGLWIDDKMKARRRRKQSK